MYFRRAIVFGALLALGACRVAINQPVGGGSGAMSLGPNESGCLTGASKVFADYWDGKSDEKKIGAFYDCAGSSLTMFVERTRGETPGVYTGRELRRFIEKYFVDDFKITDALLDETMVLKQALLGGSKDSLTADELARARALLTALKAESVRLLPYLPLTKDNFAAHDAAFIDGAAETIEAAGRRVGGMLDETGYPYYLSHLDTFLVELDHAMQPATAAFATARTFLPYVPQLKRLLLGPGGERIASGEWATLIVTGARFHALGLRMENLRRNYPVITVGEGRERLMRIARDGVALVDNSVARHSAETIRFEELDAILERFDLVKKLEFQSGLPGSKNRVSLTTETVEKTMRIAVRRFLGGGNAGPQGRDADGVTRAALSRLLASLEHWNDGQAYLEGLFARAGSKPGDASEVEPSRLFGAGGASDAKLDELISSSVPLYAGEDSMFTFRPFRAQHRHSFHNLSEQNWLHELVRLLITAYGDESHRSRGVTVAEFGQLVDDIKPVVIELKMFDRDNLTAAQQRFREANLFTYASNGDGFVDEEEAAQLVGFMVSGKRLANWIHKDAAAACLPNGELDPFDYPTLQPKCFRDFFFSHVDTYWARMPGLLDYYRKLSPRAKAEFRINFENAARKLRYTDKKFVDSSDTEGWGMVSHYVETIYSRFDRDTSGGLSLAEARDAYPMFRGTVAEIFRIQTGKEASDFQLESLYTYLLAHGAPPQTDASGLASFAWWMARKPSWSFQADRGKIVMIFSELSK